MSEDIKLVYTGSRVESLYLEEILNENNIVSIRRDTLSSSVQAGWADGSPEDAARIFVHTEEFDKAKKVLDEYFANRDKK